ncbi:MAG TPA: CAP domain-containing protein [Acidimicrobiales bacterium]
MRRPSPARLLLAFLVACLAPLGALAATGVGDAAGNKLGHAASGSGHTGLLGLSEHRDAATSPEPGAGRSSTTSSTTASTTTTTAPPTTPPTTVPPTTAPPAPAPPPPPSPTEQVVALANAARAEAGCDPLAVDERLTAAAQAHSDDMAANDYFSHDSLDGRTFVDRVLAAGYPRPSAENIAAGQRTAQAVHDAWMGSDGHRANILNCDFTAIGVGLNASAWTWTQDFGS